MDLPVGGDFAVTDNDGCEGPCLRVVVAGWELVSVPDRVRIRARMERLWLGYPDSI